MRQREVLAVGEQLAVVAVERTAWLRRLPRRVRPHRVVHVREIDDPPEVRAGRVHRVESTRPLHGGQAELGDELVFQRARVDAAVAPLAPVGAPVLRDAIERLAKALLDERLSLGAGDSSCLTLTRRFGRGPADVNSAGVLSRDTTLSQLSIIARAFSTSGPCSSSP